MSNEYLTMYKILTDFLPQMLFVVVFMPMLLVSLAIRFMRNPKKI